MLNFRSIKVQINLFFYGTELLALLALNALVPFLNKIQDFKLKTALKTS